VNKIDSKLVCQELGNHQKKQEKIIPQISKVISSYSLPEKFQLFLSTIFINENNFNANRHLRL